jgi:predicted enzyme related to lactoylglutathione lyase
LVAIDPRASIRNLCGVAAANSTFDSATREIGQIAVTVGDVAQAIVFYGDVLGLKFLFAAGPNLAFLAAGAVRIMLTTPQGHGEIGKNSVLYFKVADIEATHATVVARGAANERTPQLTAKMPDHALWIGFVRDPDGNLVGLMEEKR